MKRFITLAIVVTVLASIGGCFVGWEDEGGGGRGGGHYRDGGHDRGRDHDRGGGHDEHR